MAQSKNNVITHGLSGLVGGMIVFRNYNGRIIVANKPRMRTGELSEAQKAHLKLFYEAVSYAKLAMKDPEIKAAYQVNAGEGKTPYNMAIADYLHAPVIEQIDVSAYRGKAGNVIIVRATDDFRVKEVSVSIYDADGMEVEKGAAVLSVDGIDWVYTVRTDNTSLDGDKIVVLASDLPGHTTTGEQIL